MPRYESINEADVEKLRYWEIEKFLLRENYPCSVSTAVIQSLPDENFWRVEYRNEKCREWDSNPRMEVLQFGERQLRKEQTTPRGITSRSG